MKIMGRLLQSKAATCEATAASTITLATNIQVEIDFMMEQFDSMVYSIENGIINIKETGLYEVQYAISSLQIGSKIKKDSIEVQALLGNAEVKKSRSRTYVGAGLDGTGTNAITFFVTVEQANTSLHIHAQRKANTNVVNIVPEESSITVKRLRGL